MREIKLRAYRKDYSTGKYRMFAPFLLEWLMIKGTAPMEFTSNEDGGNWDADTITVQYTGLKDKNGKEIYEGDIIKICYGSGFELIQTEVIFKDGSFRDNYFRYVLPESKEMEIIGNIYETPNLLED